MTLILSERQVGLQGLSDTWRREHELLFDSEPNENRIRGRHAHRIDERLAHPSVRAAFKKKRPSTSTVAIGDCKQVFRRAPSQ